MKTKTMRIASFLLVLCMLTACMISGTFAKYTTKGEGSDTATVAKWGVNVTVSGISLFAKEYGDTVKASTETKVVAPGTNGTLAGIQIAGTPEVASVISCSAVVTLSGFESYCPLVFNVGGAELKVGGDIADAPALAAKVAEEVAKLGTAAAVGTDLSNAEIKDITWSWPFESGNDTADTALGDAATAKVEFGLTVTVTQVD